MGEEARRAAAAEDGERFRSKLACVMILYVCAKSVRRLVMPMRITRNLWSSLLRMGEPHIDPAGDGRVLIAPQNPFVNTRLFASFTRIPLCGPLGLCRVSWGLKKAVLFLATAAGFVAALSSVSVAQQFRNVSTEAGMIPLQTRPWGNPIWGDINNDGFIDLIVPKHELSSSGPRGNGPPPFIYLNNGDGTFADIRATSGMHKESPDTGDWLGFAFGDYDGDGNLDLFIAEPPFQSGSQQGPTRDLLYKGQGNGTFDYVSDTAGIETGSNYGKCSFWVDYDNDGKLDLFVKNITSSGATGRVNVL